MAKKKTKIAFFIPSKPSSFAEADFRHQVSDLKGIVFPFEGSRQQEHPILDLRQQPSRKICHINSYDFIIERGDISAGDL